ncbi:hypothetical protein K438DRAFT_1965311 [Mycena galopus ATCC 62051]|nr:hypothetical protein K438DRAFT_1965311 [Mycena galopus ATCC 62051]
MALFYHFNIDVHDIEFVTTEGNVRPTPENSQLIHPSNEEGRSSMVFFNQSTMHRGPAPDFGSLIEVAANSVSTKVDYVTELQAAFQKYVVFCPMPKVSISGSYEQS